MQHHFWSGAAPQPGHYMDHAQHQAPLTPMDKTTVSAVEVGAAFALQYFRIMKTRPDDLHLFYSNDSRISRGTPGDVRHANGPTRIRELLYKEHSCGTQLALAVINNLECQDSVAGAVIVQVGLLVWLIS